MSTLKQDKDLLDNFNTVILGKLRANRFKSHWRNLTVEGCIKRIEEELLELKEAIKVGKKAHIVMEAANVAVFCAMLFDNVTNPETE